MPKLLLSDTAELVTNQNGAPLSLEVSPSDYKKDQKPVVVAFDAVDEMNFCSMTPLYQFTASQQEDVLKTLNLHLSKSGGKFLFRINAECLRDAKNILNLDIVPVIPEPKYDWFKRLFFYNPAITSQIKEEKLLSYQDKFQVLEKEQYTLCDKKSELLNRAKEISDLLLNHARWMEPTDPTYSEEGVRHRINVENSHPIAVIHNNKVVAFVRVYSHEPSQISYFGDLVVEESHRKQGIAARLMQEVFKIPGIILGIAGEEELLQLYHKFGFLRVSENKVEFGDGDVLVSGVRPTAGFLKEYINNIKPSNNNNQAIFSNAPQSAFFQAANTTVTETTTTTTTITTLTPENTGFVP